MKTVKIYKKTDGTIQFRTKPFFGDKIGKEFKVPANLEIVIPTSTKPIFSRKSGFPVPLINEDNKPALLVNGEALILEEVV